MRRALDAVLLAAVATVVGIAVVDAFESPPRDPAADAAAELRAADVHGSLVVAADDCTRRQLELPSLRAHRLGVVACSVYGRPGSLAVYRGGVVWYAFAGGTTTLLRREQLDAYLGRHARVLRVAWLGNVRFAATYRVEGLPGETLALFERGNLVRVVSRAASFGDVRSSPNGRMLAVRAPDGLVLYDALGERLPLPEEATHADAVAWSPDERWTVATGEEGTFLFRTRATAVTARIPAPGVDVDWATPT